MKTIIDQFFSAAAVTGLAPFGSGHINASYRFSVGGRSYLLQKINHHVFPDVAALTANIRLVTDHLRERIAAASGEAARQQTLRLVPTHSGAYWHRDERGDYWRVYDFLGGLVAYDLVETPEQAYAGARSYGHFLRFLSDLPAERLVPVLPDFHNVEFRLRNFTAARSRVRGQLAGRLRQCAPEVRRVLALADELSELQKAWDTGRIPSRITHNDTKFNNVLLSPEGEGRAVVDLDTVMPGIVHFDYGDGIRTATSTVAEDEADLGLLDIDQEKYRAFTEGYLSVTRDLLTPAELHYLPRSGALLAYLMAVRFLTDYFEGDVYYATKHPEHNLVRARNQLRLAELLWDFGKRAHKS